MTMMRAIHMMFKFLQSAKMNQISHRVAAYLLLFTNLIFPHGAHRVWMGIKGWWLFPIFGGASAIGMWQYVITHEFGWKLLGIPFAILFMLDAWGLFIVSVPEKGKRS